MLSGMWLERSTVVLLLATSTFGTSSPNLSTSSTHRHSKRLQGTEAVTTGAPLSEPLADTHVQIKVGSNYIEPNPADVKGNKNSQVSARAGSDSKAKFGQNYRKPAPENDMGKMKSSMTAIGSLDAEAKLGPNYRKPAPKDNMGKKRSRMATRGSWDAEAKLGPNYRKPGPEDDMRKKKARMVARGSWDAKAKLGPNYREPDPEDDMGEKKAKMDARGSWEAEEQLGPNYRNPASEDDMGEEKTRKAARGSWEAEAKLGPNYRKPISDASKERGLAILKEKARRREEQRYNPVFLPRSEQRYRPGDVVSPAYDDTPDLQPPSEYSDDMGNENSRMAARGNWDAEAKLGPNYRKPAPEDDMGKKKARMDARGSWDAEAKLGPIYRKPISDASEERGLAILKERARRRGEQRYNPVFLPRSEQWHGQGDVVPPTYEDTPDLQPRSEPSDDMGIENSRMAARGSWDPEAKLGPNYRKPISDASRERGLAILKERARRRGEQRYNPVLLPRSEQWYGPGNVVPPTYDDTPVLQSRSEHSYGPGDYVPPIYDENDGSWMSSRTAHTEQIPDYNDYYYDMMP